MAAGLAAAAIILTGYLRKPGHSENQ
jgi:hypothetical protein